MSEKQFFKTTFNPYLGPGEPKQPCRIMGTRPCMSVTKDKQGTVIKTEYKNSVCSGICERFDKEI